MKANWKIALMCVATLAFVACENKNKPSGGGGGGGQEEFVSKVSVTDNSIAEWDNLPAEYVVEAKCPADAAYLGLKSVKVYADQLYINVLVEIDDLTITDRSWTPFHLYINTDNSDKTGGYGDQYADANVDVMLEGAVFSDGEPCEFNPGVSNWYGEVGGTGWEWCPAGAANDESDCWCAKVCAGDMPVGTSQCVNGKFEMQIMRELIPTDAGWSEEAFGVGFDIQQNWSTAGLLPQVSPTEDNPNGLAKKMQIKIDMSK